MTELGTDDGPGRDGPRWRGRLDWRDRLDWEAWRNWRAWLDWREWPRGLIGAAAAAGAAGLAAVVGVVSVSLLGQTPGPAPRPPSVLAGAVSHAGAVQLLITASDAAARSQPVTATGRQFAYLESLVSFGSQGGLAPLQTHLRQTWTPAADLCAGGLLIEYGQRYPLTTPTRPAGTAAPKCPDPGRLDQPTIRLLESLPTRPANLLKLIRRARIASLSPDAAAFTTISSILRDSIVPPKVTAALYRATAMLPETSLVPQNWDAVGRPGVAVLFTYRNLQLEWIFDTRTFRLLGELDFSNGQLTGESATLVRAIVSHAGELPRRA